MFEVQENISLKPFNTFNVDAVARYFVEIHSENDLIQLCKILPDYSKVMVLGGGSNVLFRNDYDGLIIKNNIRDQQFDPNGDGMVVTLGGGEIWHQAVIASAKKGLFGLENLALIPGTVGAAPMQNIGAYGVELKDVFRGLNAVNLTTGDSEYFDLNQCEFGYRDSVFKRMPAGNYCITSVELNLKKHGQVKTFYGEIEKELDQRGLIAESITPLQMTDVISSIRQRKLPDPAKLPNAGSFFKNPVVDKSTHETLKESYPKLVSYALPNGEFKLACGWLIDALGWKGRSLNGAKVHDHQALVLINEGGGAKAICELANAIQQSVMDEYGVPIEPEPLWVS